MPTEEINKLIKKYNAIKLIDNSDQESITTIVRNLRDLVLCSYEIRDFLAEITELLENVDNNLADLLNKEEETFSPTPEEISYWVNFGHFPDRGDK